MIAINPKSTVPYVLEEERGLPAEKQTTWHTRALTLDEQAQIRDMLLARDVDSGAVIVRNGTAELATLRMGLERVDNFVDEAGVKVEIKKVNGLVPDDFIERISPRHRAELARAVANRGHVTSAEGN